MGVSQNRGTPKWMVYNLLYWKTLLKWMILGFSPYCLETPKCLGSSTVPWSVWVFPPENPPKPHRRFWLDIAKVDPEDPETKLGCSLLLKIFGELLG